MYSSRLSFNPGDLVRISRVTRWGGTMSTGLQGIIIDRTYTAYEAHYSKWNVLVNGKVETILESKLRLVQESK